MGVRGGGGGGAVLAPGPFACRRRKSVEELSDITGRRGGGNRSGRESEGSRGVERGAPAVSLSSRPRDCLLAIRAPPEHLFPVYLLQATGRTRLRFGCL